MENNKPRTLPRCYRDRYGWHRGTLRRQVSLRHPGETPNWYAEKVIYDLERDRGAR